MFELIFGNLVIRLLIGSAVAVLMAALLIALKNHLQVANTNRTERRAERAQALALALEEESETAAAVEALVVAEKSTRKTPVPVAAKPAPTPTAVAPAPVAQAAAPVAAAATSTETPAATTPEGQPPAAGDAAATGIQDILSSVFGDEEAAGHPEALLFGLKELDTTDLLTLATRLAAQLNARTMYGKEI